MAEKTLKEYLDELDKIVKELENKDIELELAVKKYNEGVALAKKCQELLEKAEKLVVVEED